MRAVVLTSYGDPEVLQLQEVPDPTAGPDEVIYGLPDHGHGDCPRAHAATPAVP